MKRSPWLYACAVIPLVIGAFLLCGGGTIDLTARFPQLSLNGQTNIVSDNGSMWTFNGVPFCTNCGGGLAINPTDTYVPYRIDATTFGDSWFYRLANGMGIDTNLYWGVGQTNSTSRAGTTLEYTVNGAATATLAVVNTNSRSRMTISSDGSSGSFQGGTGTAQFGLLSGSDGILVGSGYVIPVASGKKLGSGGTPWGDFNWNSTNYGYGFSSGSDYSRLAIHHGGTNDAIHFDSQSAGTAGAPRDFIFSTSGVPAYHIPGTSWDDSQVPEAMVRTGATAPTLANFNGGPVQTLQFQNNRDDTIMATVQMTHRWKQGTDIHPHVHWCETAATGAGTNIVWQLTYAWTNIGCAYPAYTTITITNSITGTNWFSQLSDFPDISGTGHLVSSIFVFELKRLANSATADDYNQNVAFLGFDIHHQVDSPGSDSELTKSF